MFVLPRDIHDAIIAQALAEAPFECCGILAGKDGRVLRRYPATNARRSLVEYAIHPMELLKLDREIEREDGWEVVAIYHSHTRTEAYPSWKDVAAAGYPQARYLIVSLKDAERPHIRAFRILERALPEHEQRRLERERRHFDEVVAALPEDERQRAQDEWWALEMVTRRQIQEEELLVE